MKTKITDNFLGEDMSSFLKEMFLYKIPHWWGHFSSEVDQKNENFMYKHELNLQDPFIKFIFVKICKSNLISLKPLRAVVNIQHPGMEGTFHSDYGDVTCIYMVTDTLKNKDGALDVDNKIINFVKDRLVLIDAKKAHKGYAPKKGVRITLAYQCERINA
jgi:hypothetical protein|tara:strand:+ start:1193 stop:1672 length:480 start_codon:yes stop_codon:yes gene_type:complete